jgi:hypothetical protein
LLGVLCDYQHQQDYSGNIATTVVSQRFLLFCSATPLLFLQSLVFFTFCNEYFHLLRIPIVVTRYHQANCFREQHKIIILSLSTFNMSHESNSIRRNDNRISEIILFIIILFHLPSGQCCTTDSFNAITPRKNLRLCDLLQPKKKCIRM